MSGAVAQPASPARGTRHWHWALGLVALALALRVGFVLVWGRTAFAPNDTSFYASAAKSLALGHGYRSLGFLTGHWPPAYPFVISLVYRVVGVHPQAALLTNAVFGAATVGLLYLVAARTLGAWPARLAAGALALMPGPILIGGVTLSESLYAFELVGMLALVVLLPHRWWRMVVVGVGIGFAILTRGEGVLLPFMVLAVWWRELGLRRALVAVVVTGLVACLTIAPWTIRNASVFHRFVPVSTNWSTTFWSGHNPAADGGPTYAPPSLLGPATAGKYGPDRELAESKVLGDAAKKWALHHPLQELALIPRKLLVLASGDSGAITLWLNGHGVLVLKGRTYTIFSALADLASYALVLLTLLAVAIRRRAVWTNGGTRGPLAFLALACVLYGVVYYGNFRYHIPLEPFMLLLAAPLVTETWERIRARRRRTVPGGVADGPPQALSHSA